MYVILETSPNLWTYKQLAYAHNCGEVSSCLLSPAIQGSQLMTEELGVNSRSLFSSFLCLAPEATVLLPRFGKSG